MASGLSSDKMVSRLRLSLSFMGSSDEVMIRFLFELKCGSVLVTHLD